MNAFIVKTKILPSAKNGGVLRSVTKICCSNQLCNNWVFLVFWLWVLVTDLIVDWIKFLYYRKMKPISIGAKLLPVTTLQRKQYGVVLRNESTRRVYHNFGAFLSAGLNHCFGNKKNKVFSLFWKKI